MGMLHLHVCLYAHIFKDVMIAMVHKHIANGNGVMLTTWNAEMSPLYLVLS